MWTLLGPVPTYNGIPIGPYSPLVGRPAVSGGRRTRDSSRPAIQQRADTAISSSAFVSRSDDSDFLGGYDINGGNSLLLPNRNLDHGYAKLDLGGSFRLRDWLGVYAQAENLTNNQHIAPIGYVSLPTSIRVGLKLQWGKEKPNVTPSAPTIKRRSSSAPVTGSKPGPVACKTIASVTDFVTIYVDSGLTISQSIFHRNIRNERLSQEFLFGKTGPHVTNYP